MSELIRFLIKVLNASFIECDHISILSNQISELAGHAVDICRRMKKHPGRNALFGRLF